MSALVWLLPGVPSATGALLALAGRRADRVASATAVGIAVATLVLAVYAAVTRPAAYTSLFAGVRAGLAVDGLSAVMVVTVAAVTLAVLVFAAGEMREARFFGLMLLFAGAMLVTVTAVDLALLLMAWEVMGAMSYALIGYWWWDGERVRAANVAFVTTRAGDLGLYLAAGCAITATGSLGLSGLPASERPWRDLIAAGVVAAALGKSAQLPYSFWLSRAMAGPSPVSALLHSATMVAAGAYLLLRSQPLLASTGWAATLVAWAGALTALLLGAVAVAQRDLKQLLAASTCAQLGFAVLAAGVGAVAGGAAQLVAHALVKSLLFLCAGAWLTALGAQDLAELEGAARRHRLVGITFGIGALALAGLPPLSLWVTKDSILTVVAAQSTPLYVVSLGGVLLAAAYATKAILAVWQAPADRHGVAQVGRLERLPLPALALGAAVFGVVGLPAVFMRWRDLVGAPDEPGPAAAELLLSGVLAIATALAVRPMARAIRRWSEQAVPPVRPRPLGTSGGAALVARRWSLRVLALLGGWLYLERGAVAGVWRPLMGLARGLARFDDQVLDRAVRSVPRAGMAVAAVVRRPVEAGVEDVTRRVAAAVGRLGSLARRPQTGQVHTYFAQAAVALVLLAVVIVLVS